MSELSNLLSNLWIKEEIFEVVGEKRYLLGGDSQAYESRYNKEELLALFRRCQKTYGRCVSKMFVESSEGKQHQIGWVFEKRQLYEDCQRSEPSGSHRHRNECWYTQETWVSLHTGPTEIRKINRYFYIPSHIAGQPSLA